MYKLNELYVKDYSDSGNHIVPQKERNSKMSPTCMFLKKLLRMVAFFLDK